MSVCSCQLERGMLCPEATDCLLGFGGVRSGREKTSRGRKRMDSDGESEKRRVFLCRCLLEVLKGNPVKVVGAMEVPNCRRG